MKISGTLTNCKINKEFFNKFGEKEIMASLEFDGICPQCESFLGFFNQIGLNPLTIRGSSLTADNRRTAKYLMACEDLDRLKVFQRVLDQQIKLLEHGHIPDERTEGFKNG